MGKEENNIYKKSLIINYWKEILVIAVSHEVDENFSIPKTLHSLRSYLNVHVSTIIYVLQ